MDKSVGRAAVEAVVRSAVRHQFRAVKLKYAGGEPTLRWPLVRTLHSYAGTITQRHRLDLHATLLSNGTCLTAAMIDWMRDQQVRLMISLDGLGAVHDAQRSFHNGRGSYDAVVQGIDRALARDLTPYLSITVSEQSVGHLVDVVAFALERDLPFNLNFVRDVASVKRLLEPDVQQRWIAGLLDALSVIEEHLPRRRLIDSLLDRSLFNAPHMRACGAGRSYLVIDPNGGIAHCQMCLNDVVTYVNTDDPLEIVRRTGTNYQNMIVDRRESCRNCPWRYWCGGGCPLLTKLVYGSERASPYCAVYRALFPKLLYLEGLRLLKWSGLA